jgi:hypothetical protein
MIRSITSLAFAGLLAGACVPHPLAMTGDPDRQITEAEFMDMAPHLTPFVYWDTNRDGFLSPAEFEAGMRLAGMAVPHGFDVWDTDGDGRLSEEEFYRGMFRALDPDGRGYVTEGNLVRHTRPLRR